MDFNCFFVSFVQLNHMYLMHLFVLKKVRGIEGSFDLDDWFQSGKWHNGKRLLLISAIALVTFGDISAALGQQWKH